MCTDTGFRSAYTHLNRLYEAHGDVLTRVWWFPRAFEAHSPFLQPVGVNVDLSDLVVKTEKQ